MNAKWVSGLYSKNRLKDDKSPRKSYRTFPNWTSRFWTWLTGVPDDGQLPLFSLSPGTYAVFAVGTYFSGIAIGVASFRFHGLTFPLTLIVGWCMTVNGARRMISTVVHQCVHGAFSGNGGVDLRLGEVLSVLTLTQTAADYRRDHFELHHRHEVFSSIGDPSARLLWDAGFRAGLSVRRRWWNLFAAALSARFHGRFIGRRVASQFRARIEWYRLLALLTLSTGLAVLISIASTHAVLLGAVFPITVLYQMSVLFEFVSEHAWFVERKPMGRKKYVHGTHSWGRFCGRRTPAATGTSTWRQITDWTMWIVEHLVYHLPVRLVVLPGDLSQHDFHHRNPSASEWTTAVYARQADVGTGDQRWPPYQEFWGLHNAIGHVFEGISSARPPAAIDDPPRIA